MWMKLVALMLLIQGLAAAIDIALKSSERGGLYTALIRWWVRIDETRVPELHLPVAGWAIRVLDFLKMEGWASHKSLGRTAMVSFVLTNLALELPVIVFIRTWGIWGNLLAQTVGGWLPWATVLGIFLLFSLNFLADVATFAFTRRAVVAILRGPFWRASLAIVGEFLLATFVSLLTFNILVFIDTYTRLTSEHPGMSSYRVIASPETIIIRVASAKLSAEIDRRTAGLSDEAREKIKQQFIEEQYARVRNAAALGSMGYLVTTLLPAGFYLFILIAAILAKLLLLTARWLALEVLERSLPSEFKNWKPFSLFAALLNTIVLFGALVVSLGQ